MDPSAYATGAAGGLARPLLQPEDTTMLAAIVAIASGRGMDEKRTLASLRFVIN
jgi:hypothetical protein